MSSTARDTSGIRVRVRVIYMNMVSVRVGGTSGIQVRVSVGVAAKATSAVNIRARVGGTCTVWRA